MNLKDVVNKDCICILDENTKTEVLLKLINLVNKFEKIENIENLTKEIFYREQLMSTGIGMGLGIPHVRYKNIKKPIIAIGIQPNGVIDYQSVDDKPVNIVIMILVGENQHKEHIRLLSQIVNKFKSNDIKNKILNTKDIDQIYKIIIE